MATNITSSCGHVCACRTTGLADWRAGPDHVHLHRTSRRWHRCSHSASCAALALRATLLLPAFAPHLLYLTAVLTCWLPTSRLLPLNAPHTTRRAPRCYLRLLSSSHMLLHISLAACLLAHRRLRRALDLSYRLACALPGGAPRRVCALLPIAPPSHSHALLRTPAHYSPRLFSYLLPVTRGILRM